MKYAGIDVSKDTLQVAIGDMDGFVVDNTATGHRTLVKRLAEAGVERVVVEATGPYSLGVATAIAAMPTCAVMVANPRHTKSFARSLGQRGKTDVADANMLLRYVRSVDFQEWRPLGKALSHLRSVMRRRDDLVATRANERKRLAAEKALPEPAAFALRSMESLIKHLSEGIKELEAEALRHARVTPSLAGCLNLFTTVPGIAGVTALTVIAEAGHLLGHVGAKQLVAYAGLDPRPWQSGKMDARRRISRQGNKRLRCAMYIAAWNATKYSEHVRDWRQRLVDRGKPPKVADIAVARRLLHALTGMLANNAEWDGTTFLTAKSGRKAA